MKRNTVMMTTQLAISDRPVSSIILETVTFLHNIFRVSALITETAETQISMAAPYPWMLTIIWTPGFTRVDMQQIYHNYVKMQWGRYLRWG